MQKVKMNISVQMSFMLQALIAALSLPLIIMMDEAGDLAVDPATLGKLDIAQLGQPFVAFMLAFVISSGVSPIFVRNRRGSPLWLAVGAITVGVGITSLAVFAMTFRFGVFAANLGVVMGLIGPITLQKALLQGAEMGGVDGT